MKLNNQTKCIGRTSDLRAVWQNGEQKPFICVHDAKGRQHFLELDEPFDQISEPYTYGNLSKLTP